MISEEVQRWVLNLLAVPRGHRHWLSQRKIVEMVGISRSSVLTIKNRGYVKMCTTTAVNDTGRTLKNVGICDTCGAKVSLPCRACDIRRTLKYQSRRKIADLPGDLGLDLHVGDLRRYRQARAWVQTQTKKFGPLSPKWPDCPAFE